MSENELKPKLRFKGFVNNLKIRKLNECGDLISGYAFKSEYFGENGIKLFTPKNFTKYGKENFTIENTKYTSERVDDKYICKKGDLLVLLTDLTPSCELLGKPVILDSQKVLLNQRIVKFVTNKEIDKIFLLNFLLTDSYHKRIKETASGTTVRHSSNKAIEETSIYLPSLDEQQKIASFLSAVDSYIENLKQQKEALEQYKKGMMQKIFNRQIRFKDENGKEFPEWEEKPLNEVSFITTGSSNREDSSEVGEYTFFDRSVDIRKSNKYLYDTEAIIVAGEGQEFIPKYFYGKFDLHQRAYAIMYFKNVIGRFLYYYINHNKEYLKKMSVGTTMPSLRLPIFNKMHIRLPNLEEQTKIATILSEQDRLIEAKKLKIEKAEKWKKGLLQQLFI